MPKKKYKNIIRLVFIVLSYFVIQVCFVYKNQHVLLANNLNKEDWNPSILESGDVLLNLYTGQGVDKDIIIPNAFDFGLTSGCKVFIPKSTIRDAAVHANSLNGTLSTSSNGSGETAKIYCDCEGIYQDDWSDTFSNLSNITAFDLSGLETSGITKMNSMFKNCSSLTDISSLGKWDVSGVASMNSMFDGCNGLTDISGLKNWDVSGVASMNSMFSGCNGLTDISSLGEWDVAGVASMNSMFDGCNGLTDISSLGEWDVAGVASMNSMFNGCNGLTDISSLGKWDVAGVASMNSMFDGCNGLTDISGLKKWNVSGVASMNSMFSGCNGLTDISSLGKWNVAKVTDMNSMFNGCNGLTDISSLGEWDVAKVTDMNSMFGECISLDFADLSKWNIDSNCNVNSMFKVNPVEEKSFPILVLTKNTNLYQNNDPGTDASHPYYGRKKIDSVSVSLPYRKFRDEAKEKKFNNVYSIYLPNQIESWLKDGDAEKIIRYFLKSKSESGIIGSETYTYSVEAVYSDLPDIYENEHTWPTAKKNLFYNGEEQELLDTGQLSFPTECSLLYKFEDDQDYQELSSSRKLTKKSVGKYNLYLKIAGNNIFNDLDYAGNPLEIEIKKGIINNKESLWPTAKKNLFYNDEEQVLVNKPVETNLPEGCVLKYKFDGENNWNNYDLENPPKQKNLGEYKIYFKIFGGDNYKDLICPENPIIAKILEKKDDDKKSDDANNNKIENKNTSYSWSSINKIDEANINNKTYVNEITDSYENKKIISNINLPYEIKYKKFINGYEDNTFRPENKLTRAEFANMIYKLINDDKKINLESLNKFDDIKKNMWYANAIAYLADKKIINGYENKFNPDNFITRAEIAQILFNILKLYDNNSLDIYAYSYGDYNYDFKDLYDQKNDWSRETIKQLASNKMINGYDDKTFRPNQHITRAEAVAMLSKVFDRYLSDDDACDKNNKNKFIDLDKSHWAFKYIINAIE